MSVLSCGGSNVHRLSIDNECNWEQPMQTKVTSSDNTNRDYIPVWEQLTMDHHQNDESFTSYIEFMYIGCSKWHCYLSINGVKLNLSVKTGTHVL